MGSVDTGTRQAEIIPMPIDQKCRASAIKNPRPEGVDSLLSKSGMSTLTDTPAKAIYSDGIVEITMNSGDLLRIPVAKNPRLSRGSEAELSDIKLSPFGIHWPQLDEDLSIRGILAGDFGQVEN